MRQKSSLIGFFFLPLFFGFFFALPMVVEAKTVYVNENGSDDDDGSSSSKPFKSLEKAAEEVNDGNADEVKLAKGEYDGKVTFEKKVAIQGAGKSSTTITGALIFKKDVELRNVAIRTKNLNAITLGKDSVGELKDVDIRDFLGVGVWVTSGRGALKLEDSRIGSSSGKGIYAEAGTKLEVINSSIVGNKQEGIDIRQNTRGNIKNNLIEDNGESGIELIVGSSDFIISGNNIKKNGSSGIAFQFYTLNKKSGAITATANNFSSNKKSGIDCNQPQGGDSPSGYWADSIALEGNTFSNNDKEISTRCQLLEAKSAEEEKALQEKLAEEERMKAEEARLAALSLEEKAAEDERLMKEREYTEELVIKAEDVVQREPYETSIKNVEAQKKYKVFLWGRSGPETEALEILIAEDEFRLQELKAELSGLPPYQADQSLQERVRTQEAKIEQYKAILASYEAEKGLLSSFPQNFYERINTLIYVLPF